MTPKDKYQKKLSEGCCKQTSWKEYEADCFRDCGDLTFFHTTQKKAMNDWHLAKGDTEKQLQATRDYEQCLVDCGFSDSLMPEPERLVLMQKIIDGPDTCDFILMAMRWYFYLYHATYCPELKGREDIRQIDCLNDEHEAVYDTPLKDVFSYAD